MYGMNTFSGTSYEAVDVHKLVIQKGKDLLSFFSFFLCFVGVQRMEPEKNGKLQDFIRQMRRKRSFFAFLL
jgi:hypothetical protein